MPVFDPPSKLSHIGVFWVDLSEYAVHMRVEFRVSTWPRDGGETVVRVPPLL
jgi:hypothetical protein